MHAVPSISATIAAAHRAPAPSAIATNCSWISHANGDRLFAVVNEPHGPVLGTTLILPPYGTGVYDLFMPSFYLASAGFRTIRFDGRYNVGKSTGLIGKYRMSDLFADAELVTDHFANVLDEGRFLVVGMSMAAPAALNLLRSYDHAGAMLMVPAVDICDTIERAVGDPGCTEPFRSRRPDAPLMLPVFGFDVEAQPFYDDLAKLGLHTLEGALAAAAPAKRRVDLVLAERDEYVSAEAASRLVGVLEAEEHCVVLPCAGHEFGRSLSAAKAGFGELVRCSERYFSVGKEEVLKALPSAAKLVAAASADQATIADFVNCAGESSE